MESLETKVRPSIELIQQWFGHDSATGQLIRKKKLRDDLSDLVPLNKRIWFLGKRYPYSHIVWVVCKNKWPDVYVDHKDHNQLNMRIENLREANASQNQHNKQMLNPNGKGVAFDKSVYREKPWVARIMVNHKSVFLGSFKTKEEAAQAYQKACLKYHGEFACPK